MNPLNETHYPNIELKRVISFALFSVLTATSLSLWLISQATNERAALLAVTLTNATLILLYLGWSYLVLSKHARTTSDLEKKFKAVLLAAPDPMLVIDKKGSILLASSQFENYFGYRSEELIGRNMQILIPERFRSKHPKHVEDFMRAPRVRPMGAGVELFALKKDGGEFPVEIALSPLSTSQGVFIVSTIRDVTERKQAEKALTDKSEELARSNAELERFAYLASHDLQEPLRMINSYLTLLEKKCRPYMDKDASEFLGFAQDGAKRLKLLINDLLIYSKAGSQKIPLVPVSCEKVLAAVTKNLEVALSDGTATLKQENLPLVMGSESVLEQLFQNLISNAIKYRRDSPAKIEIAAKREEAHWLFSIKDNGVGIGENDKKRIFEMFQRLHGKDIPGTGIGLATCKRIVERLGGTIWVESRLGEGSTFYFTLPAPETCDLFSHPRDGVLKVAITP